MPQPLDSNLGGQHTNACELLQALLQFQALEEALGGQVMWLTPAERQDIKDAFALKGFPGCVGVIDGSLMPITQRPHHHGDFTLTGSQGTL